MGCSFYRVINGGILLSKSHSQAEGSVQSASIWRQRGICQSTDRSYTTIWSLSLIKRYQSRCPNSFVQERTTTKWNCLLNGGAEGAKSTTEARRYVKVEARDRESGGEDWLNECHFTLIGMGVIPVYSISPVLLINGVPWDASPGGSFMVKIPTWSTRSSLIKALQPTQQKKLRVLVEWNRHIISFLRSGSGSNSLIEEMDWYGFFPAALSSSHFLFMTEKEKSLDSVYEVNEGLLNEKRNPPLERKKPSILYLTIPASPSSRLTWRLNGLMIHQRAQANSKRLRSGKTGWKSPVCR